MRQATISQQIAVVWRANWDRNPAPNYSLLWSCYSPFDSGIVAGAADEAPAVVVPAVFTIEKSVEHIFSCQFRYNGLLDISNLGAVKCFPRQQVSFLVTARVIARTGEAAELHLVRAIAPR